MKSICFYSRYFMHYTTHIRKSQCGNCLREKYREYIWTILKSIGRNLVCEHFCLNINNIFSTFLCHFSKFRRASNGTSNVSCHHIRLLQRPLVIKAKRGAVFCAPKYYIFDFVSSFSANLLKLSSSIGLP